MTVKMIRRILPVGPFMMMNLDEDLIGQETTLSTFASILNKPKVQVQVFCFLRSCEFCAIFWLHPKILTQPGSVAVMSIFFFVARRGIDACARIVLIILDWKFLQRA
ncbi:hypothetical protein P8452_50616 [Trifolium repens]|nr:hypothetical protein P8452_50616 [Trifolium repens]